MPCLFVVSKVTVFTQTWHATSLHLSGNGTSLHSSERSGTRLSQFPNQFKKIPENKHNRFPGAA
ncbi:MAG: hypothetical protein HDS16_05980 [Bacteroides sp.]|nr:hypothetical protein [Bacteroides sp.]